MQFDSLFGRKSDALQAQTRKTDLIFNLEVRKVEASDIGSLHNSQVSIKISSLFVSSYKSSSAKRSTRKIFAL